MSALPSTLFEACLLISNSNTVVDGALTCASFPQAARDRGLSVSRLQTPKRGVDEAANDPASLLSVEGRGGRLLQSKSNPNLSQITSFEVDDDGQNGKLSSPQSDEQKSSIEGPEIKETNSDASREKSENLKQKTKSGTNRGRKERPVTPSYKSFLQDVSSAGNEAGKPPRPNSSSLSSSSPDHFGDSTSVLKSVDIVIETT